MEYKTTYHNHKSKSSTWSFMMVLKYQRIKAYNYALIYVYLITFNRRGNFLFDVQNVAKLFEGNNTFCNGHVVTTC